MFNEQSKYTHIKVRIMYEHICVYKFIIMFNVYGIRANPRICSRCTESVHILNSETNQTVSEFI